MNEAPKMSPVPGLQTPVALTKSTPEKLMFWSNFVFYADIRYYNLERKHSALEYLTPARFEQLIHHPK